MTPSQLATRIDRGLDQIQLRLVKRYQGIYSPEHIAERVAERAGVRAGK